MTDEQYIDIAIEISKNAKYPYGAIVVKDNQIIGRNDEKNATSLLHENQSLASTSSFHFIDDYIKEKGITKKLTK